MNNINFFKNCMSSCFRCFVVIVLSIFTLGNALAASVTYSVHAVTDRSGTANTSNPGNPRGATGYTTGTFNVGQIIRVP